MKILHLSTYPFGGAGVAARRICRAEQKVGIQPEMLTKPPVDPHNLPFLFRCRRKTKFLISKLSITQNPILHSWGLCGSSFVSTINRSDADIVHLHWVNDSFLTIRDIACIQKPLVWTLHDSWAFCGAEHYQDVLLKDFRYRDGYAKENFPASSRGLDIDRYVWLWKKYCWKNLKCTFTAPSRWEASCFEESALFRGQVCHVIPNPADQDVFHPADRKTVRKVLNIPEDRKVIAFGAFQFDDPIKGASFLLEALKILMQKRKDLFLLVFGNGPEQSLAELKIPHCCPGFVQSEQQMAKLYQAADVFVCPSIAENLPNTCVEASCCGVPIAAFNTGGISDIVQHGKNGFLARPFEPSDLAEGIGFCLDNREHLSSAAWILAKEKFPGEKVAEQFLRLYEEVLSEK